EEPRDRGDVDDRAAALADEPEVAVLDEVERTFQVGVDHRVEVLVAYRGRQGVPDDAGIVDQDVDLPQLGVDCLHDSGGLVRVGDVAAVGLRLPAPRLDLPPSLVGTGPVGGVDDGDHRTLLGETQRHGPPQPSRPTRHDRHLAVESHDRAPARDMIATMSPMLAASANSTSGSEMSRRSMVAVMISARSMELAPSSRMLSRGVTVPTSGITSPNTVVKAESTSSCRAFSFRMFLLVIGLPVVVGLPAVVAGYSP